MRLYSIAGFFVCYIFQKVGAFRYGFLLLTARSWAVS
jgi:hypothetical protein